MIGTTIGHEITHAFDDSGSLYNEKGNWKFWWRDDTFEKFNQLTKCMVHQYGNFSLWNGLKIKGNYTLGENIADNGAVKVAYNAYLKYVSQFGEELQLPALNYTSKQLFWIATAKSDCSKSTPQMIKTRIDTNRHSPEKARVNVVMSNVKEFAADFKCPLGSTMNPIKRCTVW